MVSPGQLQTVGIAFCENAFFKTFDGVRHRTPRGNTVHSGTIQFFVHIKNAVRIIVHAQTAQSQNGLIFGFVGILERPGFAAKTTATQWTGVTVVFDHDTV